MPSLAAIEFHIAELLSIPDEELTPEQREEVEAFLEDLAEMEADKVDRYVAFLSEQEARANYFDEQAAKLRTKGKSIRVKLERSKRYMREVLQANGLKKVSGKLYSASVRTISAVVVDDEAKLPPEYWREKVERSPNKDLIKREMKEGVVIPGASLVPTYSLITR